MTPREKIIAAAQKHAERVRASATSDIATAEEMLTQVTSGLTDSVAEAVLRVHRGNAMYAFQEITLGQMSGEQLSALAERMVNAKSETESKAIEEELVRGFYGSKPPAKPSAAADRTRKDPSPTG